MSADREALRQARERLLKARLNDLPARTALDDLQPELDAMEAVIETARHYWTEPSGERAGKCLDALDALTEIRKGMLDG